MLKTRLTFSKKCCFETAISASFNPKEIPMHIVNTTRVTRAIIKSDFIHLPVLQQKLVFCTKTQIHRLIPVYPLKTYVMLGIYSMLNPFPDNKIQALSQLKAFADNSFNVTG